MAPKENNDVLMEDVEIIFRNFEGKEGMFNDKGDRNFNVILPPDIAEKMDADGWNIKYLKPDEDEEVGRAILPVKVSYKNRPPRIVTITSRGRTNLDESMIEILDYADIKMVDLIVTPYHWSLPSGKSGIKAYVKSMFVTLEEDALEIKYGANEKEA